MDLARSILLCAALSCLPTLASALTVAVVRPPNPTPSVTEALVRLRGELHSVGLEVKVADSPAGRGRVTTISRAWLEDVATEPGVDAIVAISGDDGQIVAEVWVPDQGPRKFLVSMVALEPNLPNASERLAIRTVEVLRSSWLETRLTTQERSERATKPPANAKAATSTVPRSEARENARPPNRVGLEAGAAARTSLDGVGLELLPILRVDWAVHATTDLQATVAGLGTRPAITTTAGHALVAQPYALVGGRYRMGSRRWFWPFVALSAGVLHAAVEGRAVAPKQGHAVNSWSFLLDGSLGAGLRLLDRCEVSLAAHVQWAEPYVAIHFVDEIVATSGRPNVLLSLTIGAWL